MSHESGSAGNVTDDGAPGDPIDMIFTTACSCAASNAGSISNSSCGRQNSSDTRGTTYSSGQTLSGTKRSQGKGNRPDPNKLAETMGKHMANSNMTPRDPTRWPEWVTSGTELMSVFLRQRLDQSRPAGYKAIKFKEGAEQVEQAAVSAVFSCLSTLPEASQVLQVHIFRVNASRSVLTFIDAADDWCYVPVDWDELDAWMVEWSKSRPMKTITAFPTLG